MTVQELAQAFNSKDFPQIVKQDGYLTNYKDAFKYRFEQLLSWLSRFDGEGGLEAVANSKMGFTITNSSIEYKEYAPNPKIKEAF